MQKKKFKRSTIQDRIDMLRQAIREVTASHGVPCMCTLCESLQFDSMAANNLINLKTGQRA